METLMIFLWLLMAPVDYVEDLLQEAIQHLNAIKTPVLPSRKLEIVKVKVDPVAGRKASGRLHIREFYVDFGKDGTLSAYTQRNYTEAPFTGRYTITGDQIEFTLGPSKFVGTIKGNRITGKRSRSDGVTDDWELTLE